MKKLPLLLFLFLISCPIIFGKTTITINTEDHPSKGVSMKSFSADSPSSKALKQLQREENKWLKLEEKLDRFLTGKNSEAFQQRFGLLDDPVNKWFWFWIFGWSLGLLITLISGATITTGFLGILWLLGFVGGSIALVIWLLKKFG